MNMSIVEHNTRWAVDLDIVHNHNRWVEDLWKNLPLSFFPKARLDQNIAMYNRRAQSTQVKFTGRIIGEDYARIVWSRLNPSLPIELYVYNMLSHAAGVYKRAIIKDFVRELRTLGVSAIEYRDFSQVDFKSDTTALAVIHVNCLGWAAPYDPTLVEKYLWGVQAFLTNWMPYGITLGDARRMALEPENMDRLSAALNKRVENMTFMVLNSDNNPEEASDWMALSIFIELSRKNKAFTKLLGSSEIDATII
jgi:hypothetical protein